MTDNKRKKRSGARKTSKAASQRKKNVVPYVHEIYLARIEQIRTKTERSESCYQHYRLWYLGRITGKARFAKFASEHYERGLGDPLVFRLADWPEEEFLHVITLNRRGKIRLAFLRVDPKRMEIRMRKSVASYLVKHLEELV